jgi:hypothetical protein
MYYRGVTEPAADRAVASAPASIPTGHPSVRAARVAAGVCVVTTGAFTLFALVTTQLKNVRSASPWQDDPYDAVVSFTELLVPLLTAMLVVRAVLLFVGTTQPTFRVRQLVRASLVSMTLVAVTALVDVMASLRRADHPLWTPGTPWLIASLAPLEALACAGIATAVIAARQVPAAGRAEPGDWLADVGHVADLAAGRHVDRPRLDHAISLVRRHLVVIALLTAAIAGTAISVEQGVIEGWTSPLLFATSAVVGAGGLFAAAILCNRVLGVIAAVRPATHPIAPRQTLLAAATVAGVALPVSAGFRDTLWHLMGQAGAVHTPAEFAGIAGGAAGASFVVALGVGFAVNGVRRLPVRTRPPGPPTSGSTSCR